MLDYLTIDQIRALRSDLWTFIDNHPAYPEYLEVGEGPTDLIAAFEEAERCDDAISAYIRLTLW